MLDINSFNFLEISTYISFHLLNTWVNISNIRKQAFTNTGSICSWKLLLLLIQLMNLQQSFSSLSSGNLGNSLPNPYTSVFIENIGGTRWNLVEPLFLLLSKYNKNKKTQQPKCEDFTTRNPGTPNLNHSLHIYSVPS